MYIYMYMCSLYRRQRERDPTAHICKPTQCNAAEAEPICIFVYKQIYVYIYIFICNVLYVNIHRYFF